MQYRVNRSCIIVPLAVSAFAAHPWAACYFLTQWMEDGPILTDQLFALMCLAVPGICNALMLFASPMEYRPIVNCGVLIGGALFSVACGVFGGLVDGRSGGHAPRPQHEIVFAGI